jgi:hypothetical protein
MPTPPNMTTRSDGAWYASAVARALGAAAGNACVHAAPSQSQVSARYDGPAGSMPPNRTTCARARSYATAARLRDGDGNATGRRFQRSPSHRLISSLPIRSNACRASSKVSASSFSWFRSSATLLPRSTQAPPPAASRTSPNVVDWGSNTGGMKPPYDTTRSLTGS